MLRMDGAVLWCAAPTAESDAQDPEFGEQSSESSREGGKLRDSAGGEPGHRKEERGMRAAETFDLGNFGEQLERRVRLLEDAHEADRLQGEVEGLADASILGVHLAAAYTHLATVETRSALRRPALEGLLLQFRATLQAPTCVAETARPWLRRHDSDPSPNPWHLDRRNRIERVAARVGKGPPVMLRVDQLISARAWGIGFRFGDLGVADELERALAEAATRDFGRDLRDLQRILERFAAVPEPAVFRMVPRPEQRYFERLMLDILNEDTHRASLARLEEDFMEKTDFRVRYPGLDRKNGGRVQVTQTCNRSGHAVKLEAIRRVNEFVILSPLTLAQYILDSHSRGPGMPAVSAELEGLQRSMGDADADTVAERLKTTFLTAIAQPHTSPAGPLAQVPPPVRRAIRSWVESETRRATSELREREESRGRTRPGRTGRVRPKARPPTDGRADSGAPRVDAAKQRRRANGPAQIAALQSLSSGQMLEGVVESIVRYGFFIRIGDAVGLAHHAQMRPPHTPETVTAMAPGSVVTVEVLQVDVEELLLGLALA